MTEQSKTVSLDELLSNLREHLKQIEESGEPRFITVDDRKFVLQDFATYNGMLDVIDEVETHLAIARGLEDVKAGRVTPWRELKHKWESRLDEFR